MELKRARNAELVAVCSRDKACAQGFADEFGMAGAYGSYAEMLARDDIDIVYVASPNFLHAEHALMCLSAGKNVVCEKPMARSVMETKRMIDAAEATDLFLVEGLWMRFFPAYKKTMEWIRQGRIGRPLYLDAHFGIAVPGSVSDPEDNAWLAWRKDVSGGGGSISDLGLYGVALSWDVMGGLPDEIQTVVQRYNGGTGTDRQNAIIFRHGDSLSHLSSSFVSRRPTCASIYGELGSIILGQHFWQPDTAELRTNQGNPFSDEPADKFTDEYVDEAHEGFRYEIEAVSGYVMEGRRQAPEMTWEDSTRLARAMEAVRKKWGMPTAL